MVRDTFFQKAEEGGIQGEKRIGVINTNFPNLRGVYTTKPILPVPQVILQREVRHFP